MNKYKFLIITKLIIKNIFIDLKIINNILGAKASFSYPS